MTKVDPNQNENDDNTNHMKIEICIICCTWGFPQRVDISISSWKQLDWSFTIWLWSFKYLWCKLALSFCLGYESRVRLGDLRTRNRFLDQGLLQDKQVNEWIWWVHATRCTSYVLHTSFRQKCLKLRRHALSVLVT